MPGKADQEENMKVWNKSWSSWSGKSSESSLHLDDIQDAPKHSSLVHDNDGVYQGRALSRSEQRTSANSSKLANAEMSVSVSLKIQEHINRLQDYSELCERANRLAAAKEEPPSSPYAWIRRFKNRETREIALHSRSDQSLTGLTGSNPPTPHGSFLVPRTGSGSSRHNLSNPSSPRSGTCSREGSFRRRQSCPTSEAKAGLQTLQPCDGRDGRDGGGSGSGANGSGSGSSSGDPDHSDMYRRQVAVALKQGRTVWL
jgi:hypothetical protein